MTEPAARATSRAAWTIYSVAVAAYFVAVVHRTALGVAGIEAIDRFGIEATALSLLSVLQVAVYALMQVPAGTLLDRFGPARVILTGSLVMAVGQALMAFAPGFGWALAARVLIGAGDAPLFIAVARLVAQHFPPTRVPVMVQLTGLIGQTGQLATAIPLAALLHAAGWPPAFATLSLLGLVAAAAVWSAMVRRGRDGRVGRETAPATPSSAAPSAPSAGLREALRTARRTPGVRLGFWTHFLGLYATNTVALLWGVPFFVTAQQRSASDASLLLTTMVLAHIALAPVVGRLTALHPLRRSWIVLGMAAVNLANWAALLIPDTPRPLAQLVVFAAVLGASGPVSLIGLDYARSFAAEGRAGTAAGFANMGGFLGTVVGVLLVGVVLQAVSPAGVSEYTLDEYRLAFAALLLPWAVGVAGVVSSRRRTRAVMAAGGVVVPPLREALRRRRRAGDGRGGGRGRG